MTTIGGLRLRCRNRVVEPELRQDGVRLTAEVEWRLTGSAEHVADVAAALGPRIVDHIAAGVALIRFGNSVGWFDAPRLGRIEVHSGKWTAEHFNAMLRDLTGIAAALPFAADSGSALPFEREVPLSREILYHAFVYLRHVIREVQGDNNLATAVRIVLADPHERLVRRERVVDPALACNVGPRALEEVLCGRHQLFDAPPSGCTAPLASALGGRLPRTISEDVVRREVDTAENRFVKTFLGQVLWIIEECGARLARQKAGLANQIRRDATAMHRALEPLARHRFWRSVGPLVVIPEASTVLQRRRGYRELFGHFAALRLASRVPLSAKDVTRLLEAKDIATLYELWCYFQVVEAVEQIEGRPLHAEVVHYTDFDASVRHGYHVRWKNGVSVAYNSRFAQRGEAGRVSYSVPLRPDISVRVPPGRPNSGLHLLDAKFKVSNLGELLATDLDDDPQALDHSSFKRVDLYKMHTYRDAIVGTQTVWVLYPGEECSFYGVDSREPLADLASLRDGAEGVGAVALRPEPDGAKALFQLTTTLLSRGG